MNQPFLASGLMHNLFLLVINSFLFVRNETYTECELRGAPPLKVHDVFCAKTAGLIFKQLGSYESPTYPLQLGV